MDKRILINIPDISKKDGGIYQYTVALLNLVGTKLQDIEFYIYCISPGEDIEKIVSAYDHVHFININEIDGSLTERVKLKILKIIQKLTGFTRKIFIKDIYDRIIEKYNIQIIHTPYQNLIKKPGVKSITTMHDVQELHFPEFFDSAQRAYRAWHYKRCIDEADAVVVSYDHIKNDIVKFFAKPSEMVHVILLDMIKLWFNQINDNSSKSINQKFEVPEKFFLYPASTWEHKNHLRLFKALKKLEVNDVFLVCTGYQTEYYEQKLKPYIEKNGLEDKIRFLGIVSDEELLSLYKGCKAVVIPSLYEAGSFPLMESIMIDVPVICSKVTSLPETIGDNRFLFDPYDLMDIQEKMTKIWSDEVYRSLNREVIRNQKELLKNNKSETRFHQLYKNLLSQ